MPSEHGEAPEPSPPAGRGAAPGLVWLTLALGVVPLLGAWFPPSPEPPQSWDQATHLLLAADYHDVWVQDGFPAWSRARQVSSFYPPFYHACVAALFPLVGPSARAASLVGGVALVVLALATGAVARRWYGLAAGVLAAAFVLASPSFAALAGQPLLDLTLASLVAVTLWLAVSPRFLASWPRAAAFGLVVGAGLLTKWVYPAFVAGPLLVRLLRRPRPRPAHWLLAAAVAAVVAGAWYVPHASELVELGRASSAAGRAEGDPRGLELDSLRFYPTAVVMFFPLPLRVLLIVAAAVAGLRWMRRAPMPREGEPAWVLGAWLAVPLVAFTCLDNKDPRYIAAAAPALAILAARAVLAIGDVRARAALLAATCLYVLALQVVRWRADDPPQAVTRALAFSPRLAALASLDVLAFVVPDPAGWPVRDVVEEVRGRLTPVSPWASLAVVPDLPYVNAPTLRWAARREGFDLRTFHPGEPPAAAEYSFWEYALVKPDGAQGTPHATGSSETITAGVMARSDTLRSVTLFPAPEGPLLLLRARHADPPADLRPRHGLVDLQADPSFWHLGDGWSFREEWGRWAIGRRAVVRVQLAKDEPHRVTVSLTPPDPLVGAQVVTVRYRDRRLRSFRLDRATWDWEDAAMELPRGLASGGIDELTLDFTRSVPASQGELTRSLSAAVRSVRFQPLPD